MLNTRTAGNLVVELLQFGEGAHFAHAVQLGDGVDGLKEGNVSKRHVLAVGVLLCANVVVVVALQHALEVRKPLWQDDRVEIWLHLTLPLKS